jgi:hypothetical protein
MGAVSNRKPLRLPTKMVRGHNHWSIWKYDPDSTPPAGADFDYLIIVVKLLD